MDSFEKRMSPDWDDTPNFEVDLERCGQFGTIEKAVEAVPVWSASKTLITIDCTKCSGPRANYTNRVSYAKQLDLYGTAHFMDISYIDGVSDCYTIKFKKKAFGNCIDYYKDVVDILEDAYWLPMKKVTIKLLLNFHKH